MVTLAAGDVVLAPFPFSDLSKSKLRPEVHPSATRALWWLLHKDGGSHVKAFAECMNLGHGERAYTTQHGGHVGR